MTFDKQMKKVQTALEFAGLNRLASYMQLIRESYHREKAQLEKKLSWYYEERKHFVKVINDAIRIAAEGDKRIAKLEAKLKDATLDGDMFSKGWDQALVKNRELKADNEELVASFNLYDDAVRRGIKIWQAVTGKFWLHPDGAEMVAWLLERSDQIEDERDKLLGLFGDYEFSPTVEQCVKIWNNLMKERHQLKEELALRNTTLDLVDALTKRIELRVENMQRNADLLIEQKEEIQVENMALNNFKDFALQRFPGLYGSWLSTQEGYIFKTKRRFKRGQ